MLFKSTVAMALAAVAAATPTYVTKNGLKVRTDAKKCLCQSDVDILAKAYVDAIDHWEPEYANFLSDVSFYDRSESINQLAGRPEGSVLFPVKAAFVGYQSTTPDNLETIVLDKVGPWNCDEISLIWSAKFTKIPNADPLLTRGIAVLGATYENDMWKIKSIDVEFSTLHYLKNIGGSYTLPPPRP